MDEISMCGAIILQLYYNLVCFTLLKLNHKKFLRHIVRTRNFYISSRQPLRWKLLPTCVKRKQFCLLLLNYTFLLVCRIQTRRMHKTPFTSEFQTAEIINLNTEAKEKSQRFQYQTFHHQTFQGCLVALRYF